MVCFINFEIFFNCLLFSDPKTPTEEVILALTNGTYFHKIRSFDKFYYRKYHVDLETMRIYYKPSVKSYYFKEVPYSKIIYFIKLFIYFIILVDVGDLQEVRKGWNTDRFNLIKSRLSRKLHASIQPKNLPDLKPENCFSLIFDSSTETLDLIAANQVTRDLWIKGLDYLSAICKNDQKEHEYEE